MSPDDASVASMSTEYGVYVWADHNCGIGNP
jgi:hypothetical protein